MDPSRKRAIRLTVALTVAVLLASALIYTSFSAGRDELTASQLVNRAKPHTEYILAGTVIKSQRTASTLYFRVRDPKRDVSVPVSYQGSIPGPFAVGRGVLVSVRKTNSGVYVGQPGSLTTKCPSKYQAAAAGSDQLMAPAGRVLLILALLCTIYGFGASLYGARTGARVWVVSARRAMYSLFGIAATAFVILDVAFVSNDFSYNIVASGSSTTTPFFYRIAAVWATQSGSLLLWVMLLSFWSSIALYITRNKVREMVPYAQAVLFGLAGFFTALTVLFANPFATSSPAPAEGAGLDPLLRHTTMMIHPPMLYSGYTLMLVPFAFAVGALISGRVNAEWIQVTRRFALAAWLCLGIGILLGARWSYTELGLGRLLGVGSGRERRTDAVAAVHRVHPLDHDPREARDAEGVERVAGAAGRDDGDHRHVPRPLRDPELDPRVRLRPDLELRVRVADRGDGDRLGVPGHASA